MGIKVKTVLTDYPGCIVMSGKNFKERDGVPDLRRAARFRYASVTLPEVATLFT